MHFTLQASQFRVATLQVLHSHMWLLATLVDCAVLEFHGGDYTVHNKINLLLF